MIRVATGMTAMAPSLAMAKTPLSYEEIKLGDGMCHIKAHSHRQCLKGSLLQNSLVTLCAEACTVAQ